MARAFWNHLRNRPTAQIELVNSSSRLPRSLVADTGAGSTRDGYELILSENDCRLFGGEPARSLILGGAYSGQFSVYVVQIEIPELAFRRYHRAVGVPSLPSGFDGIACFRFLNQFYYGNFGDPKRFGLEL